MTRQEIVDRFMDTASKVGAEVMRVTSLEELDRAVLELLKDTDSIYCPNRTEKERSLTVVSERGTDDYADASASVEEVFAAVAETGCLVCSSQTGAPVQGGLLPPHHVAIVDSETITADLEEFTELWPGEPPTNITLETGPSRTADIELTLTIGVHGPERLSIIVI